MASTHATSVRVRVFANSGCLRRLTGLALNDVRDHFHQSVGKHLHMPFIAPRSISWSKENGVAHFAWPGGNQNDTHRFLQLSFEVRTGLSRMNDRDFEGVGAYRVEVDIQQPDGEILRLVRERGDLATRTSSSSPVASPETSRVLQSTLRKSSGSRALCDISATDMLNTSIISTSSDIPPPYSEMDVDTLDACIKRRQESDDDVSNRSMSKRSRPSSWDNEVREVSAKKRTHGRVKTEEPLGRMPPPPRTVHGNRRTPEEKRRDELVRLYRENKHQREALKALTEYLRKKVTEDELMRLERVTQWPMGARGFYRDDC